MTSVEAQARRPDELLATEVDRGAAEQELDMEGRRAAAANAVEPVLVLQLGDHTLGIGHPPPVRPDAGGAFRACPSLEREPLRVRARLATVARQHRLLRRDMRDDPPLRGVLP